MALEHTAWRLTRIIADDGSAQAMEAADEQDNVTAGFEPDEAGVLRIAGRGGCNRYTAACVVTGETLTFGPVATTRMMCPPEVMEREARYLQMLASAQRYEQDDSHLTILCQAGELRYRRADKE